MVREAPWKGSFVVDGVDGGPIQLRQLDRDTFALTSDIRYVGARTGLEDKGVPADVLDRIRELEPASQPGGVILTDLASVPGPTRWFLGSYGEHTPAAIIHDELIPAPPNLSGMTDAKADRYLRFMLADIGVRLLKRWIMWAAVALRSRFAAGGLRRVLIIGWLVAALVGNGVFGFALLHWNLPLMLRAAAAPAVFAGLWGRQYGAGLVAAVTAPWLLPPTVLAVIGYVVYLILEWLGDQAVRLLQAVGLLRHRERDTGTYRPSAMP